jgi:hypothetical protein
VCRGLPPDIFIEPTKEQFQCFNKMLNETIPFDAVVISKLRFFELLRQK